jgi:TPR repeat protein
MLRVLFQTRRSKQLLNISKNAFITCENKHKCTNRLNQFVPRWLSTDTDAMKWRIYSQKLMNGELDKLENNRQYEAEQWLEAAAEEGDQEAQFRLAMILLDNEKSDIENEDEHVDEENTKVSSREEVMRTINEAKRRARKEKKKRIKKMTENSSGSSSSSGSIKNNVSDKLVGEYLESKEMTRPERGMYWLRKAASSSYGAAMTALGNVLMESHAQSLSLSKGHNGIEKGIQDGMEGLLWYQRAASLSEPYPDALYNLGLLHFEGRKDILPKNLIKSFDYFMKGNFNV